MIRLVYKRRLTAIDRIRKKCLNRIWYTKRISNCKMCDHMITKNELIQLYEDNGFIISQKDDCYTIMDKEIHRNFMGKACEVKCTIDNMLMLAIKAGIVKIIN